MGYCIVHWYVTKNNNKQVRRKLGGRGDPPPPDFAGIENRTEEINRQYIRPTRFLLLPPPLTKNQVHSEHCEHTCNLLKKHFMEFIRKKILAQHATSY